MTAGKNLSIETLRGIAILLVVAGHVIGSAPDGGMKIDFPHPLRYLYLWIDYIQMPLFTAIAGVGVCFEACCFARWFRGVCTQKGYAVAGADDCSGNALFRDTVSCTGNQQQGRYYPDVAYLCFSIYHLLVLALAVSYLHDTVVHRSLQEDGKPPPVGGVVCDCHITECGERPRNDARAAQSFQFQGGVGATALFFFAGVGACRFAREFHGAGCLVRLSLWVAAFLGVALIQVVWFASAEVAAVAHELYVLTVIATLFLLLEMRVHNRFFCMAGRLCV